MKKLKNPPAKHSLAFKALSLVVLAIIVMVILEVTNTTHLFHKAKLTVSTIPSTHPSSTTAPSTSKTQAQTNTSYSPTTTQSEKNTSQAPAASSSSTAAPVTPTGDFVSDHQPNLSGSPHPSQENSVCVTTPGATCYIEFTQSSVVNKLDAQTTDSNGAAYWTWDVAKDGLTTGSWQVTAVATLNGKTTTSTDPEALVINQ